MGRVGIFPGTFDPIHHGHLITGQSVFEKRSYEKIILIPNNISPHKTHLESSSPADRIEMLKLVISKNPQFDFSAIEIERGKVSYTYSTLLELKKSYDDMDLILGYDNIIDFDTWFKPDEILKLASLVVLKRHTDKEVKVHHRFFGEAIFLDTPLIEISASAIRKRVRYNMPIDFLVPDYVKEYIYSNNLYK